MIKVLVNNVEYPLREYSLTIQETVNERAVCSLSIKTDTNTAIEKGMTIEVLSEEEVLFSGFISAAKHKDYSNVRIYTIDAADFHFLVDKRVYVRGFTNETCGNIIKTMVDEILADEGITYTANSIQAGYNITGISFNYKKCSEVLDQLAEIANYVWYVDYEGVLHFKMANAYGSAPVVTDAAIIDNSMTIANKNNQYRNKQYVKGAVSETGDITQKFYGDGANQTFTLGYRLSDKPKIWVNGVYVLEDDIVVKGYNESAKWFYQKQDGVILQNPAHTPIPLGQEIRVVYKGLFPIIAITESPAEIERNYQLGAGTGVVEDVADESDITSLSTAINTAVGRLGKYCGNTYEVKFKTKEKGYDVGQLVNFRTSEFNEDNLLITNISIIDDIDFVWYEITAAKGALNDSWERVLGNGLKPKPTVANIDLEEQETVVLNKSLSKTWTYTENPNIMRILFPNGSVSAGQAFTPTFEYEHRVNYIEILDANNNVLARNIKSVQTDPAAGTIYTYFYIDPFAAVGKWAKVRFYGGYQADFKIGSGVLIDEQPLVLNKTELEGIQIARTDIKGF